MEDLNQELGIMRSHGIAVAHEGDLDALREAAEYLAAALPHERARLKLYFHSGVRAYAESGPHVIQCMNALSAAADDLK